jgi:hypothetical protein
MVLGSFRWCSVRFVEQTRERLNAQDDRSYQKFARAAVRAEEPGPRLGAVTDLPFAVTSLAQGFPASPGGLHPNSQTTHRKDEP